MDVRPVHMFFDREKDSQKILNGACAHAGLKIDRGRIVCVMKCVPVCFLCRQDNTIREVNKSI